MAVNQKLEKRGVRLDWGEARRRRWISYLSIKEKGVGGTVCLLLLFFSERFRQIHQSVTHNGVDGPVLYEDCCSFISRQQLTHTLQRMTKRNSTPPQKKKADKGIE
ncbi:hypothetical protein OUZ56_022169 [Daphnia magna]|uniref:Uncharacterized protein n=1 Tax=Daphnia magna TaxID=35525 RepID=A0ABR0AVU1_9CRUS|nr:hypothetical protein OUZ56_022169 [Daphnia magna]